MISIDDATGHLEINGSDIGDIYEHLNLLFSNFKQKRYRPEGMVQFLEGMRELKIPPSIITNTKIRKEYLKLRQKKPRKKIQF